METLYIFGLVNIYKFVLVFFPPQFYFCGKYILTYLHTYNSPIESKLGFLYVGPRL